MTRIESKHVDIARPPQDVYTFLQDMNNFQQLLPQDRISDWKSDGTSCSFKVAGAATIGLQLDGGTAPNHVRLKSTERSPFPFTLDVHLDGAGGSTQAYQVFEADLNPFIKMMVESPLRNLFDHIAERMVARSIHNVIASGAIHSPHVPRILDRFVAKPPRDDGVENGEAFQRT